MVFPRSRLVGLLSFTLLVLASCGEPQRDPVAQLLNRLPADHALHAYLDAERIRASSTLGPLLQAKIENAGEYRDFLDVIGLDHETGLSALAFSLGEHEVVAVARGRFAEERLRQYIEGQGSRCESSLRTEPCVFSREGTGRYVALTFAAEDLLAVAEAPSPEAASDLINRGFPSAESFSSEARRRLLEEAFLWLTVDPPGLERAMRSRPPGSMDLTVISRALANAERGYFSAVEGAKGGVELQLDAACGDPAQAAELRGLLAGLNSFAAAAADSGRGDAEPSDWGRVFRSGHFEQNASGVEATWFLDQAFLGKGGP